MNSPDCVSGPASWADRNEAETMLRKRFTGRVIVAGDEARLPDERPPASSRYLPVRRRGERVCGPGGAALREQRRGSHGVSPRVSA